MDSPNGSIAHALMDRQGAHACIPVHGSANGGALLEQSLPESVAAETVAALEHAATVVAEQILEGGCGEVR